MKIFSRHKENKKTLQEEFIILLDKGLIGD